MKIRFPAREVSVQFRLGAPDHPTKPIRPLSKKAAPRQHFDCYNPSGSGGTEDSSISVNPTTARESPIGKCRRLEELRIELRTNSNTMKISHQVTDLSPVRLPISPPGHS